MSQYFWEGFEKRAVDFGQLGQKVMQGGQKIMQGAKNVGAKVRDYMTSPGGPSSLADEFGKPLQQAAGSLGASAANYAKQTVKDAWHAGHEAMTESLINHAKTLGGKSGDYIYQGLEHVAKNIKDPEKITSFLQDLAGSVGLARRPKTLLERAGGFVKQHPYATTGAGIAGAGGLAYGLGRSSAPQRPQPMGGQDYQYYNPYY